MRHSCLLSFVLSVFLAGMMFAQVPVAIDGPQKSDVGQLCVFTLTDDQAVADWTIVPATEFYIDKCGQSMIFASPNPAKYTIIAATVLDEKPVILTFICDYGVDASPTPKPDPKPEPPKTIREWVAQNIPTDGQKDTKVIADCYDSAASSMERGTIRTVDAGYAGVRMCSQSKANVKIWGNFFDELGKKVSDELGQSTNTRDLAKIFREIASGLRGNTQVSGASRQVSEKKCQTSGSCATCTIR